MLIALAVLVGGGYFAATTGLSAIRERFSPPPDYTGAGSGKVLVAWAGCQLMKLALMSAVLESGSSWNITPLALCEASWAGVGWALKNAVASSALMKKRFVA